MADFVIHGFDGLDAMLAKLENSEDVRNKVCAQVGQLLVGRAKDLTKVDTGLLRLGTGATKDKEGGWHRTKPQDGRVTVYNNTEYAAHVEWGHRQKVGKYIPALGKTLKKPFVEGRHMLRDAVAETEEYLEDDVMEILEELLK